MIKRLVASALVAIVGCSGIQIDKRDNFGEIVDMRDGLAQGIHPAKKQMNTRWIYSVNLREAVNWYRSGRWNSNKNNPFHFVIEYCRLSNENVRNAENTCAETNVCDNLYLIKDNNRETQNACRDLLRGYF